MGEPWLDFPFPSQRSAFSGAALLRDEHRGEVPRVLRLRQPAKPRAVWSKGHPVRVLSQNPGSYGQETSFFFFFFFFFFGLQTDSLWQGHEFFLGPLKSKDRSFSAWCERLELPGPLQHGLELPVFPVFLPNG